MRDAETEPDAEGREEDGDERAVELDGVLDDDEAVFGVLEGGDEDTADETENEDVALHDGVGKSIPAAIVKAVVGVVLRRCSWINTGERDGVSENPCLCSNQC